MDRSRSAGPLPIWSRAASGAAIGLLVVACWFSAVSAIGEPLRATRLLAMSAGLSLLPVAALGARLRGFVRAPATWWLALAWVASTGALLPAIATGVGAALPGGVLADAALVLGWTVALLPAVALISGARLPVSAGRASALGPFAALAPVAALGWALSRGCPPVVATALGGALLLFVPQRRSVPGPRATGLGATALEALALGALATLSGLTIPPWLAAFGGASPQGALLLAITAMLGWGAAGALFPPRRTPGWIPPALVGVAALASLVIASRALDVLLLAQPDSAGGRVAALGPWWAFAAAAGVPLGLAVGAWRPASALRRPPWLATGLGIGLLVEGLLGGRGGSDLPVRVVLGLSAAASMALLIQPRREEPRAAVALGWTAAVLLVSGLVLWRPVSIVPAVLDAAARIPRFDPTLPADLEDVRGGHAGTDRAGVRGAAETGSGVHLLRGGQVLPPDRAVEAAEGLATLLPVLAAVDARTAMVVEAGRGTGLRVLGDGGIAGVSVLDRSPYAAAQLASLDEPRRSATTNPAVRFERRRALPALRPRRAAPDVLVVQLPAPHGLGAEAWYGPRLARQAARAVAPGGWVAYLVPTRSLQPADLAGTISAFERSFPGSTIWVDPAGHGDVVLLGSTAGTRPDMEHLRLGLQRQGIRRLAREIGVSDGDELIRRAFARSDRQGLAGAARSPRGLAWRSARSRLEGREAIPLLAFADLAEPPEQILDLTRVDPDRREAWVASGRHVDVYWPTYLTFLDRIARLEEVESLEWARELRETSDDPTADLRPLVRETLEAGRSASARGMRSDAEALFLLAEAFSPDDPEVHEELGRLDWQAGRDDQALRRFEAALDAEPTRLVSLLGAAEIHLRRGEREEARSLLQRAVDAHPRSVDALHNLARVELIDGRRATALTLLQQAHELQPGDARVMFAMAEATFLEAISLRDRGEPHEELLEQARLHSLQALDLAREPEALCLYGQIELVRGDLVSAQAALEEALEGAPDDFDTRAALGEVLMARHRYDAAARQFLEARRLHPDDIRVEQRLGQLRALAPAAFEE